MQSNKTQTQRQSAQPQYGGHSPATVLTAAVKHYRISCLASSHRCDCGQEDDDEDDVEKNEEEHKEEDEQQQPAAAAIRVTTTVGSLNRRI
jgi:hypothetical protein